ncbi:MAG: hypothetical protein ACI9SY_000446 [Candidatus Paceibacteria bacterium]|jgi:hypothetical protein
MGKKVLAAIIAMLPAVATTQNGYMYGGLITGEELYVIEKTLKQQIVDRLFDFERISTHPCGLQIMGDGFSCDMMLIWLHLQQASEVGLVESAERTQIMCFWVRMVANQ